MKSTLSVIKADIGSIGGHIAPATKLLDTVRAELGKHGNRLIVDHMVSHTGADIAIVMAHRRGVGHSGVHKLAWDAFVAGTAVAREQGLYGAGQDLLKDAFCGQARGIGPAVAEMEFEERPDEPVLFFAADKTDPGAFNLPLYRAFADPMNTPGLILSPQMSKGFRFTIRDVNHNDGNRMIELDAPHDLHQIAALLRDAERYVIESVHSRETGEQAVAVATSRLHNVAGKYTGKDDPAMLVRTQMNFPATGEVLAPYAIGHFGAGGMRGSHNMPLMPVVQNTGTSYFDGQPLVSCAAFAIHNGSFTDGLDCFAHPFWNEVRDRVASKAIELRRQGFFGAARLPMTELEYSGITEALATLDERFRIRAPVPERIAA